MNFLLYVLRRLLLAIATLFVLATLTFFLMRLVPGDPLAQTKEIPEVVRRNLEIRYGFNLPLWQQYFIHMKNIFLHADLGTSFRTVGREVNDIIATQFPVSAALGLFSLAFGVLVGISFGIFAAFFRNTWKDRAIMLLCVLGISLPSFLVAYLVQYALGVFPIQVWGFSSELWLRPAGWGQLRDFVAPGLSLSMGVIAIITRMTRAQMVEVSFADFLRTARMKGASPGRVVFYHQLRNALLPVVSLVGPLLAATVVGSLVVEGIFGVPGLGRAFQTAIANYDYNVIMGLTIFYAGFVIIIGLVTDIAYGIIDPRVRG